MSNDLIKKEDIDSLLTKIHEYAPQADDVTIRLAFDFAKQAHEGQFRKSGEPYIDHPVSAAHILANMHADPILVIATLLHDVPEDTHITLKEIEENFGSEIASLVGGITKLGKLKYRGVERYIENLRKMFIAMAEDVRVMIIKFADRIHNLQTLDSLPPPKQYRIALESLEIFAPIASRLGMDDIKSDLEDLSFKYVYPKEYVKMKQIRDEQIEGREKYFQQIVQETKEALKKANVDAIEVYGRNKRLYSFYKKLSRKGNEIKNVYDLVAVRVILRSVADCYATLGIIHNMWVPMPGRIKDYISQPKPNGYRSLHTTVFGGDGKPVEFQIRTVDMQEESQYGIAAHWNYNEKNGKSTKPSIQWAKELAEIQKEILNKLSDLEELKIDFLQTRIFVFTPKGDVIDLPEGATPVDFAYHIHSDIGNKCNGAKVNDKMVPVTTVLKNGDVIEIIMDKNRKGPSPDWIDNVKTHTARAHIRAAQKQSIASWLRSVLPSKK